MRINRFFVLPLLLTAVKASAFTLLSGPHEATLPVSPDAPEVVFYWDGSTPSIDEKGKFDGGRYENLDDEEFMNVLLQEAFDVWNNVKGSYLRMKVERDSGIKTDHEDKKNAIVVKKSKNLSAAAFAEPILSDDKSEIDDCDITVSENKVTAKQLAYTLAHEIGHCVGLGHNHSNRRSIMGYTRGDTNLYLSNDDRAGIIFLYMDPAYDGPRREFLGCAVIANDSNPGGVLVTVALLLSPLMLVAFRFRRQRRYH